jgi:hypothetical protein
MKGESGSDGIGWVGFTPDMAGIKPDLQPTAFLLFPLTHRSRYEHPFAGAA